MNKYAQVAINTVEKIKINPNLNPKDAWKIEAALIFGEGTHSYKKGCPKGSFLGLCEEGLIEDIPSGKYTNSECNKRYAIEAVNYLKKNGGNITVAELWNAIGNEGKRQNQQMSIVIELFNRNMIK